MATCLFQCTLSGGSVKPNQTEQTKIDWHDQHLCRGQVVGLLRLWAVGLLLVPSVPELDAHAEDSKCHLNEGWLYPDRKRLKALCPRPAYAFSPNYPLWL